MHRLAVYGTLRNPGAWGGALSNQKLLGLGQLPPEYPIYDLGSFPAVSKVDFTVKNRTVCEVYEIDDVALLRCDQIEGHPSFYERREVDIEGFGTCWVYILDKHNGIQIDSGDWNERSYR